jgi:hypothetical protein
MLLAPFVFIAACGGEELAVDEEVASLRPSLASICSYRCFNSHGAYACGDSRFTGQANVGVYPLIENATKVPSTLLGTAGWSSTSCPNCQWTLNSITTTYLQGGTGPSSATAVNNASVHKTMSQPIEYEWNGTFSITIWDPTDASVGTCTLNVDASLVNY